MNYWKAFLTDMRNVSSGNSLTNSIEKLQQEIDKGRNSKGKALSQFVIAQKKLQQKALIARRGQLYYSPMLGMIINGMIPTKFDRYTNTGLKPFVR